MCIRDSFYDIGESVSLSFKGDILAIGSKSSKGCSRIYKYDSIQIDWIQIGQDIPGEGASVELSNDGVFLAIGRPNSKSNVSKDGSSFLHKFDENMNSWIQIGKMVSGVKIRDRSGKSVSISSNGLILAIGGISGKVKVYDFSLTEKK